MSTTLADINNLIKDRKRDSTSVSIDMTTVGLRAINSTLQIWSEVHDFPWTINTAQFNYNPGIDKYAISSIASDFKFDVTLKNFKTVDKKNEYDKVSPLKFHSAQLFSKRYAIAIEGRSQYLLCKANVGNQAAIESASAYNSNGTWVGASAISNVATDSYESLDQTSSISFDYSGTSGTLTNSTMQAVDLSMYKDRSNLYFNVYLQSVTNFTSIALKWGSSSGNYYTSTATTDYLGASFATGWNKVKIPWSSPTTVGTPVTTAMNYLQATIAYSVNPSSTSLRIENFFISENVPLVLTYYSVNQVYDVSAAASVALFNDSAATTDYPLWSGRWDMATEPFINSVLETVFWITGEYNDQQLSRQRILEIVEPLKKRYPSQRRYATMQIVTDTNFR